MIPRVQLMLFIGLILLAIIAYHLVFGKQNACSLLDVEIDPVNLPDQNKAISTKAFVEAAVEKAKNGVSNKDLDKLRNDNEYLIGYNHDGVYQQRLACKRKNAGKANCRQKNHEFI